LGLELKKTLFRYNALISTTLSAGKGQNIRYYRVFTQEFYLERWRGAYNYEYIFIAVLVHFHKRFLIVVGWRWWIYVRLD